MENENKISELEAKTQELDAKIKEYRSMKEEMAGTIESVEKATAELRGAKEEAEKALALRENPLKAEQPDEGIEQLRSAILEKRNITLSNTGHTLTVSELFKQKDDKTNIVDLPRVFIGPNADTKIPVMGSAGTLTAVNEAGTFATGAHALSVKTLTPSGYGVSIGVSDYAMKFSAVNLENELRISISDAYRATVADIIATKVEAAIPATNKLKEAPTLAALAKLALTLADKFDDAVIVMNSAVYSVIRATATGAEDKVYLEELIRDRKIEGVPVVLASQMPSNTTTANKLYAFGGRWSDMAIAIGNQIDIRPKETAGSALHTLDAIVYFDVDVVVPANFYALAVPSV